MNVEKILIVVPVLIKSLHEERLLKRLLASIKTHEPGMLPHTLLVEEKISKDLKWLDSYPVRKVRKKGDCSYASSINLGIKCAKIAGYTAVLTVNSDIEFVEPFLAPLMRAFKYGDIVGGTLLYPNGKIQSASWHYRDDGLPLEDEKGTWLHQSKLAHTERYVGGITGALQGFKLECGEYDEHYNLSYEDVDFCVRNLLYNRKIFYTPTLKAVHVESATRGYFVGAKELASYKLYTDKISKIDVQKLNLRVEEYNNAKR